MSFIKSLLRKPAQSIYVGLILLSSAVFLSIATSQPLPGTSLHRKSAVEVDSIITKLWTEKRPESKASEIASDAYFATIKFVVDGGELSRRAQISKRFYDTSLIGQIITIKYFKETDGHVIIDAHFRDNHFGLWMLLILNSTCLALLCIKIVLKIQSNTHIEISRTLISPYFHQLCIKLFWLVSIVCILFVSPALSSSVEASTWMLIGWSSALAAVFAWILPIILNSTGESRF